MLAEGLASAVEDESDYRDGGNARLTEKDAWNRYLYLWERVVAEFGLEKKTGIYLLAGGDFVPLAALTARKKAYTGIIISVNLDEDSRGNDITPETMKDAASQTVGAVRNGISGLFDGEYNSEDERIRRFGSFINIAVDAKKIGVIKEKLARLKENGYLTDEKPDYLVLKGLGWLDLSGDFDIKKYVADLLGRIVKEDGLIVVWTLPMVEAYRKVGDRIVCVDMSRIRSTDRKVTVYANRELQSVGEFTSPGRGSTKEVIWAGEHGRMVLPAFSVKIYRNAPVFKSKLNSLPPDADGKEHFDGGWKDRLRGRAYAERMSLRARWAWIHAVRFFIPAFIAGASFFPYFVLAGAAYAADFVVVLASYILAISYPGLLASFWAITGSGGLNLNAGQKTKGVRRALLVSVLIGGFFVFIAYTGAAVSPSALGMLKVVSVILLFIYITPQIAIPRAFTRIPYWMMPLAFPLIAGPALLVNTFVSLQLYGVYLTVSALSAGMVITYFVLDLVKNWEAEEIEKKRQKLYYRAIEAFGYGYLYLLMVYSLNSAAKDLGIWNEHMLEYEYILLAVGAAVYAVYKIISWKKDKSAVKDTTDWEEKDKDGGKDYKRVVNGGEIMDDRHLQINQTAEIPGFQAGDECGADYPAECRKNAEGIFPASYDTGLIEKETPGFSPGSFIIYQSILRELKDSLEKWEDDVLSESAIFEKWIFSDQLSTGDGNPVQHTGYLFHNAISADWLSTASCFSFIRCRGITNTDGGVHDKDIKCLHNGLSNLTPDNDTIAKFLSNVNRDGKIVFNKSQIRIMLTRKNLYERLKELIECLLFLKIEGKDRYQFNGSHLAQIIKSGREKEGIITLFKELKGAGISDGSHLAQIIKS
ncbi:MAG: hypothetical protein WC335_09975, partial [Candidatus Omnitrophota bacterium]